MVRRFLERDQSGCNAENVQRSPRRAAAARKLSLRRIACYPPAVLSPSAMFNRLLRNDALAGAAARLLGLYLDLTLRSTSWTIEGDGHLAPFLPGGAVILACWHERLALLPAFWLGARRRYPDRPVAALASRHRDGRLIASVLVRFGVQIVHGSSGRTRPGQPAQDRGGAAGLRALLAGLAGGAAVLITPDGPRGPPRRAAPGVTMLAAVSGAHVLPVSAQTRRNIRLSSWDRMVIPLPFGRGALVCLAPIPVARDGVEAGHASIAAALTRAADRADVLCRPGA